MWKVKPKVLPHRRFSSLQASFSALTFYQTSALATSCIPSPRHALYQPSAPALSITPVLLCSSWSALFTSGAWCCLSLRCMQTSPWSSSASSNLLQPLPTSCLHCCKTVFNIYTHILKCGLCFYRYTPPQFKGPISPSRLTEPHGITQQTTSWWWIPPIQWCCVNHSGNAREDKTHWIEAKKDNWENCFTCSMFSIWAEMNHIRQFLVKPKHMIFQWHKLVADQHTGFDL